MPEAKVNFYQQTSDEIDEIIFLTLRRLLGGLWLPAMPFKLALWIGVIVSFIGTLAAISAIRLVQKKWPVATHDVIKVNICLRNAFNTCSKTSTVIQFSAESE